MPDYRPQFPEIFPTGDIRVSNESHRYDTFEGGSFEPVLEDFQYTLDKAPIQKIEEVTGVSSGRSTTFEKGTDYVLSADNEKIVWQDDPGDRPDSGSDFHVTYICESILSRYVAASEEELDSVDADIEDILQAKFVDQASGEDLEEIGKLFGELGQRSGRDDEQYRYYLKSVVQSFGSRGTKDGIKTAVSAATEIDKSDITIYEDFGENSYQVEVIPNTPVAGSVIEEVAQIADPSGVSFDITRFAPESETMFIEDATQFTVSEIYAEQMYVDDATAINKRAEFESAFVNDVPSTTIGNFDLVIDTALSNDTATTTEESVSFDTANWGETNWTLESN